MTTASEIPVAHTPEGFWHGQMPPPILEGCTESLPDGVPDFRGLWRAVSVEVNGEPVDDLSHVERIEQCGDRVVITAGGIIHDMRADGTLEHGVNDVGAGSGVPIHVAAVFEQGALATTTQRRRDRRDARTRWRRIDLDPPSLQSRDAHAT
jgi:hypothetical protein